jgi:hypothetical protein
MAIQVKSKVIIFFDIKGIVHKQFILVGQTVSSAYCCDNAPYHNSFFTREFLTKNNMTVVPTRLKIKLKGHHFGTSQLIEAESHAVLNTFTEHDFQGTTSRLVVASSPKDRF